MRPVATVFLLVWAFSAQAAEVTVRINGAPEIAASATRAAYNAGSAVSYEVGFGSFIELTENWRIVLNLSTEFLPDEISNSPIVADNRVVKGFAAITFVF